MTGRGRCRPEPKAKGLLVGIAAIVIAACTTTTDPVNPAETPALALEQPYPAPGHSALRAAQIHFYHDPLLVEVPPTATAGAPFTVAVTTYGGGCIAEDTTVVKVQGNRVDVVPYQRIYLPAPNGACTQELRITRRQASVVVPTAGNAIVRVIGRAAPGDSLVQVLRVVKVE